MDRIRNIAPLMNVAMAAHTTAMKWFAYVSAWAPAGS